MPLQEMLNPNLTHISEYEESQKQTSIQNKTSIFVTDDPAYPVDARKFLFHLLTDTVAICCLTSTPWFPGTAQMSYVA